MARAQRECVEGGHDVMDIGSIAEDVQPFVARSSLSKVVLARTLPDGDQV